MPERCKSGLVADRLGQLRSIIWQTTALRARQYYVLSVRFYFRVHRFPLNSFGAHLGEISLRLFPLGTSRVRTPGASRPSTDIMLPVSQESPRGPWIPNEQRPPSERPSLSLENAVRRANAGLPCFAVPAHGGVLAQCAGRQGVLAGAGRFRSAEELGVQVSGKDSSADANTLGGDLTT